MAEQTTLIPLASPALALRFRAIVLEVVAGPDAGKSAPLSGRELTVGSHPSNSLVLSDDAVSRFHFRIVAQDQGYRIVDDTSTNGTIVNGLAIRDAFLGPGAQIQLGNTTIALRQGEGEAEVALSQENQFGDAVGQSDGMREAFAKARSAAQTEATVLIRGETGTGKDLLARAIHDASGRASGPYVVFDCAAVPPGLVESALFGHVRGAFTSADRDHDGVFRAASGGTLFLDELGELPLALQPKLLRALENSQVTPVGQAEPVAVDVRIIAATHRDLREMVSSDRFRPDLYYRLAVVPIAVPPLRERREDIALLASVFLDQLLGATDVRRQSIEDKLSESFEGASNYAWPGNVRELRNVVERAVALAEAEIDIDLSSGSSAQAGALRGQLPLALAREQFDRDYLREVLASVGGDLKRAAEIAEIHPKSLARLLRRYKISR